MVTLRNPIGVFDSGVGGLSVLQRSGRSFPARICCTSPIPPTRRTGEQPNAFIEQRAIAVAQFLIGQRAKAIVVACNTATGVAVDTLRSRFALPIVGMEPALKPAASATRSGVVGVLATTQTLASVKFSRLLDRYGADVEVVLQACPRLVDQVERGDLSEGRRSGSSRSMCGRCSIAARTPSCSAARISRS